MLLASSETGVLAGMRQEKNINTEQKIPFLGDIPLLGWLFKQQTDTRVGSNLMIFITPTVIDFQREVDIRKQMDTSRELLNAEDFATLE